MANYLISFPSSAMQVPDAELAAVGEAARAVVEEARDAGVYRFAGGLDDSVAPLLVTSDGTATASTYPETATLSGGFTVIEVDTPQEAVRWATKFATACRCPQEVRCFGDDARA